MMRVLLPIIFHSLTHCIARAFEEAGHTVKVVDWRVNAKDGRKHLIEPMVIEAAKEFKPDFAFCQFQSDGLITSKLPDALRELGCFSVNWTGDVRHPLPEWYANLAPHFDVTAFSNMTDVDTVRALGHRSEFLQIGYDERIYTEGSAERSGVVFFGNNYGGYKYTESESRRQMVKAMQEEFWDQFKVYGMSWGEGTMYVNEPNDAQYLREASVAVNWDHFHRPWFASDRLLRGTACGCAMVSQWYEGIEQEHPKVVGVKSVQEAVDAVRILLGRPDVAYGLGKLNAANTREQHRWHNRVTTMEQWVK
jgi:hypothetical protein